MRGWNLFVSERKVYGFVTILTRPELAIHWILLILE
jgi:hypothetical protein